MLNDDPVYVMRLQAMSAAQQLGSVKLACQVLDIPRSTFYRWRKQWIRYGAEILRPRERHFKARYFRARDDAWADRIAGLADFPIYFIDDESAVRVQGEHEKEVTDVVGGDGWRLLPGRPV